MKEKEFKISNCFSKDFKKTIDLVGREFKEEGIDKGIVECFVEALYVNNGFDFFGNSYDKNYKIAEKTDASLKEFNKISKESLDEASSTKLREREILEFGKDISFLSITKKGKRVLDQLDYYLNIG